MAPEGWGRELGHLVDVTQFGHRSRPGAVLLFVYAHMGIMPFSGAYDNGCYRTHSTDWTNSRQVTATWTPAAQNSDGVRAPNVEPKKPPGCKEQGVHLALSD